MILVKIFADLDCYIHVKEIHLRFNLLDGSDNIFCSFFTAMQQQHLVFGDDKNGSYFEQSKLNYIVLFKGETNYNPKKEDG